MTFKRLLLLLLGLSALAAVLGLYLLPDAPEAVGTLSQKWERSTHAYAGSEAFTHWDEDEPPLIPQACAKCHSTYGYRDFIGQDGSTAGVVDRPARTGTTVHCIACHNPSAHAMTRVGFSSGVEIDGLGREAVCMQCHQGLRAAGDVERAIAGRDADAVSGDLTFINVHYYIAAATWLGTEAQGGYEYPNRSYVARFEHVPDLQACVECHDPHSQRVAWQACSPCHVTVAGFGDLRAIRTGDEDFDGDGDAEEGLYGEVETMQAQVYAAMQAYAAHVVGTPLAYAHRFPYFVVDANEDGQADADEISSSNRYAAWTPRLLRVAYNYHFSLQDRGNYAHNGGYVLQLLYDSLDDLGQRISVDMEGALRPASR